VSTEVVQVPAGVVGVAGLDEVTGGADDVGGVENPVDRLNVGVGVLFVGVGVVVECVGVGVAAVLLPPVIICLVAIGRSGLPAR
jgi:hypothetical protein